MAGIAVSVSSAVTNPVANQVVHFTASVQNNTGSDVTLTALQASTVPSGPVVGQPVYLSNVGNVSPGTGNPTITNTSTNSYGFDVVFPAPNMPGASPNNAPGGGGQSATAYPASNQRYTVTVQAQTSDGSVGQGSLVLIPASSVAPFPVPAGGQLVYVLANSASNLVNGLTVGQL
jgi:hypothetical protein